MPHGVVPHARLVTAVLLALALLLGFAASSAHAAKVPFHGHKWPRGQVTYFDATPKSYRWSVRYAVSHLNHIGAKVRFKKVASRKKAKLVLRHNPRQTQAGLADLGYRKGRRSSATFNKRDRDKYETAMLVVHELGHVLGLDHPRSGSLCAVMNPQFFQACHFQTTQTTWVCGLVQRADLKPLQRAYGKRRSTAKTGLCSVFGKRATPVVGANLAVAGAAWTDYVDPTLPAEIGPVRVLRVSLSWAAATAPAGQELYIQRADGACAAADWEQAQVASPGGETVAYDLSAGAGIDMLSSPQAGERYCYRMQALYPDDPSGPVSYGAPVELTVPADPAAG